MGFFSAAIEEWIRKRTVLALVLGCAFCLLPLAHHAERQPQNADPVITVDHGPNSPAQQDKPYVILVSLDGFRYDYGERHSAKNLQALAAQGALASQGMIPSYPSLTFPNHYTLVTGLYPEHHGIVANKFYDPARKERYAYNDAKTSRDGSWYGGTPLWVLAEKQGMRTACFFWPASDAEIAGTRPSYYLHYDDKFPEEKRIDQVVAWLRLPPEQRPHFITLYFSNTDHAGHDFGPDSQQLIDAVHRADALMGHLVDELKQLNLPVDLFIVSDHGMENRLGDWITLDQLADLSEFETVNALLYSKSADAAARAYAKLRGASDKFRVYRAGDMPKQLHFDGSLRLGDPIIVATGPYPIRAHESRDGDESKPPDKGMHGFNPHEMKTMRAIFYASGPDIRRGVKLKPFENVNIFPLIARILGLQTAPIDGNPRVLESILTPAARHRVAGSISQEARSPK